VAHCVWWLASIIGLEKELVSYIDRLEEGPCAELRVQFSREVSAIPRDLPKDQRINKLLDDTEQYPEESERSREIAALKVSGQTATG